MAAGGVAAASWASPALYAETPPLTAPPVLRGAGFGPRASRRWLVAGGFVLCACAVGVALAFATQTAELGAVVEILRQKVAAWR
jgi:hypothetical protein